MWNNTADRFLEMRPEELLMIFLVAVFGFCHLQKGLTELSLFFFNALTFHCLLRSKCLKTTVLIPPSRYKCSGIL